jgi:uncharacterized PurR-regulated membrane protein YhhQ (DUF165 family)
MFPLRNKLPGSLDFQVQSSTKRIASVTDNLSMVISSLLTTIPIIILNACQSVNLRLGLIVLFTTLFSFMLSVFSNARRNEIFGASAAFTAIQVVFVGSALGSTNTNSTSPQ